MIGLAPWGSRGGRTSHVSRAASPGLPRAAPANGTANKWGARGPGTPQARPPPGRSARSTELSERRTSPGQAPARPGCSHVAETSQLSWGFRAVPWPSRVLWPLGGNGSEQSPSWVGSWAGGSGPGS